jgi:hypothetical protein
MNYERTAMNCLSTQKSRQSLSGLTDAVSRTPLQEQPKCVLYATANRLGAEKSG